MAAAGNPRLREREELRGQLAPLGLAVRDVAPDGNCLYAALSDQLAARTSEKVPPLATASLTPLSRL